MLCLSGAFLDIRRRAWRFYRVYANTTAPVLFAAAAPERKLMGACYGHHTVTPFAVVSSYIPPPRVYDSPYYDGLIRKLSMSIAHFSNADRLLLTTQANTAALQSGWKQCLVSPALPFDIEHHLRELRPFYKKILFLNLTTALPYGPPALAANNDSMVLRLPEGLDPGSMLSCMWHAATDICLFWQWIY